eukprot:COSAG02_NODE_571_length_20173_cov_14.694032_9_plen_195_part_00
MAPIMFGALAPLQYTLEAGKLSIYLSDAGKLASSLPDLAIANGTVDVDSSDMILGYTNPSYWEIGMALLTSALLALGLNVAEMMLVEATSALTLNIANTAKFAAIILLSVVLFSTQLSFLRMIGIGLCISGVGLFNVHKARMAKAKAAAASNNEEHADLELQPLLVDSGVVSGTAMADAMIEGDATRDLEESKQ